MKKILLFLMLFIANICFAQDSIQTKKIYSLQDLENEINLKKNWKTKVGNNLAWKDMNFNDDEWKTQSAIFFNLKHADFKGEMWFRQKITIDSSLVNVPISIILNSKANSKIYLNGTYLGVFGKPKPIVKPEDELNHPVIFAFKNPGDHVLAIHYKDSTYVANKFAFTSNGFKLSLVTPQNFS